MEMKCEFPGNRIIKDKDSLIEHFSYLADSKGADKAVKKIFSTAVDVKEIKNHIIVYFETGKYPTVLRATPPGNPDKYKQWPGSFRSLIERHEMLLLFENSKNILFEKVNFRMKYLLVLADCSRFLCKDEIKTVVEESGIAKEPGKVKIPIIDYSGTCIYHPSKKNIYNEPSICYIDMDECSVEPSGKNAGSLFLDLMTGYLPAFEID